MEKFKTFLVEKITSTNTKKQLHRRTAVGKVIAYCSMKFIATGTVIEKVDGKETKIKLENQTYKDLKNQGVDIVKIKGQKPDVAFKVV